MEIKILYSDKDIAVCLKPVGLDSEKDMPAKIAAQLGKNEVFPVHRLDMAVGGLMVYALNKKAAAKLSEQVAQRQMKKEYLAIVQGRPEEDRAVLRDLLYRDKAKNKSYVVKRKRAGVKDAELEYERIESVKERSLIRITLHTGRSHQIRVQFSSRKMPLIGDVKYGSTYKDCPIALWSYALSFNHPASNVPLHFEQLPPIENFWKEFEHISKGENI